MKPARIIVPVALCLMLAACGGSSTGHSTTINGNWSATLTGAQALTGAPTLNFTITLNQTNPPSVDATDLNFLPPAPTSFCFNSSDALVSSFVSSGISGGNITGSFMLQILNGSGFFTNTLALQGTVDGKTITGSWMVTPGASQESCAASGTFKMTMM